MHPSTAVCIARKRPLGWEDAGSSVKDESKFFIGRPLTAKSGLWKPAHLAELPVVT